MTKQEIYSIPLSDLNNFSKKELLEMVKVVSPLSRVSPVTKKDDLYWIIKNILMDNIRTEDFNRQLR